MIGLVILFTDFLMARRGASLLRRAVVSAGVLAVYALTVQLLLYRTHAFLDSERLEYRQMVDQDGESEPFRLPER